MAKTVLITGASGGIGRAAAELFAQEGFSVALHYNNNEQAANALEQALTAQGCDAFCVRADVSRRNETDEMAKSVLARFGHIDVLVNNAGIAQQKLFCDITEEDWERMLSVNIGGVFHCCQSVLPGMLARKAGKIINVSSIWGIAGASCEVHYSAAKAAVIGLTKALAKELGPSGITVNCVAPGVIETPMNVALNDEARRMLADETPLERLGTASEAAQSIWFLASPAGDFYTGQVLSPNGGIVI